MALFCTPSSGVLPYIQNYRTNLCATTSRTIAFVKAEYQNTMIRMSVEGAMRYIYLILILSVLSGCAQPRHYPDVSSESGARRSQDIGIVAGKGVVYVRAITIGGQQDNNGALLNGIEIETYTKGTPRTEPDCCRHQTLIPTDELPVFIDKLRSISSILKNSNSSLRSDSTKLSVSAGKDLRVVFSSGNGTGSVVSGNPQIDGIAVPISAKNLDEFIGLLDTGAAYLVSPIMPPIAAPPMATSPSTRPPDERSFFEYDQ